MTNELGPTTTPAPSWGRRAALLGAGGLVAAAGALAGQPKAMAVPTDGAWVNTLAELRALAIAAPVAPVLVLGRNVAGDGGGGVFFWSTVAGAADDGLVVASSTSTAGRWQRVSDDQEWLNPKWYGCVCDGITDDTAAFQKTINATVASNRGVALPAGRIRLNAPVTIPAGSGSRNLSMRGNGPESSVLLLTGSGTLDLNLGKVDEYVSGRLLLRDFGIDVAAGATAPSALHVTFDHVTGATPQTSLIENFEVTGVADQTGPAIGVHMTSALAMRINGLRVAGKKNSTNNEGSVGLLLDGETIPVEMYISESKFYFVDVGIKLVGHLEGINIDHCAVVAANYGIVADAPAEHPGLWLTVTNSTTNTKKGGIIVRQWLNFNLSNNLIYGDPGAAGFDGMNIYTTVSTILSSFSQITGNIMAYIGGQTGTQNGIAIGGAAVEDSILISNNLLGYFSRGIYLLPEANRVAIPATNVFKSCAYTVANLGTSNAVAAPAAAW